jgi:hypothetical protein
VARVRGTLSDVRAHVGCLSLILGFTACGGDPAITSVTANPSTVARGGLTTLTVELENVELGLAADHHGLTARGLQAAHGESPAGMHLHTYLDDLETNPLAQTSSVTFPVIIPLATAVGPHQLIVRLHMSDHTILEPQVLLPVAITVE